MGKRPSGFLAHSCAGEPVLLSLEKLRKLGGSRAVAIDQRTADQMYEVVHAFLDRLEGARREATRAASRRSPNTLVRLVPPHRRDEVEERAAIREFEGGQSRDEAERGALRDVGIRDEV